MKHWYVSWNENVAYESEFYTDAEEGSHEWWDALRDHRELLDSKGMDDMEIELCDDDD